ncbi:MAG: hypothetical protein WCF17_15210 [Terracidiphilus sp.]
MGRDKIVRAFGYSGLFCLSAVVYAQGALQTPARVPAFALTSSQQEISIQRETDPSRPFSVVGPRGAVLGQEDGAFEVWVFPWKVLSGLRISARMDRYPVPIDVNHQAKWIEVRPDSTIITFSHANFTIREIILAPTHMQESAGTEIFFQIEAARPMTVTFSFKPEMQRMWPAESDPQPSPEWVSTGASSGFYILHLNFPQHAAAIAMPSAEPGILEPYQERAAFYPLQFVLRFDPARDAHTFFPLLVTTADTQTATTKQAFAEQLTALDRATESNYESNREHYEHLLSTSMNIETANQRLNDAFAWAEVSIEQLRVETTPDHSEKPLTAGFVASGDSVRPGFGWYFGRDALWTLYACDSVGSFETARQEMDFLLRRQSPEGKIPHEWSQTANLVDWKSLPYAFASADSTPLLQMAMNDYLRISGDKQFVAEHWAGLERAWKYETTHDSNGDGIYDNASGTGWVESWVPAMPRQEIYLAALDEQASLAFANLARVTGHDQLAAEAKERAARLAKLIEEEYLLPDEKFYAFSWNGEGEVDSTATIFPAVAWWDGDYSLSHAQAMLSRWASDEFSTDWGTRLLSGQTSFYDPISYHQGSVWPVSTGWVAVAEYRTGRTLSGYAHLMQNADLTWSQDLGNVTELLSGRFFEPLGRSTAHQLWSSGMVISPFVRGLFGLEWNVPGHTLSVTPHLPADWQDAKLRNVPYGNARLDLSFKRSGAELVVTAVHAPHGLHLASNAPGARIAGDTIRIPLPAVEVAIEGRLPAFGEETSQLKVLDQQNAARQYTLTLSGMSGQAYTLQLRENAANLKVRVEGAVLGALSDGLRAVTVTFPVGSGYVSKIVRLSW